MADEDVPDWWLLLPRQLRELPADLAAVAVVTIVTTLAATVPGLRTTPLRIVVGLPYVLFLPGYAIIAALFPEAGESPVDDDWDEDDGATTGDGITNSREREGIDGIERVALSFGLSIAVVPLIGLVLNFTPWGIRLLPILVAVDLVTLGAVAVAAHRRWDLTPDERFRVPYTEWYADLRTELLEPDSRGDAALNALLVASVLLAVGSVGYAVAVPKQGSAFTEFYVLTESDDGDLVAAGYPTNFTAGESQSVVVGISNHEHEPVRYTVVVEIQRVKRIDNRTNVTVLEEREVTRYSARLGTNETLHRNVSLQPSLVGDRLRIVFLLYKGAPPAEPTVDNAYRELHLWVSVNESTQSLPESDAQLLFPSRDSRRY